MNQEMVDSRFLDTAVVVNTCQFYYTHTRTQSSIDIDIDMWKSKNSKSHVESVK